MGILVGVDNDYPTFLYENGTMVDLSRLIDVKGFEGFAINDLGQVIGMAYIGGGPGHIVVASPSSAPAQ